MGNFCFREDQLFSRNESTYSMEGNEDTFGSSDHQKIGLADFKVQLVQNPQYHKVLGQGAYGRVFLVEQRGTRKLFAMKTLNKSDIKKESQKRHITDERFILEKVNSDFLVKLRYAFQTAHKLYLIVDYMSGGELFYHLKKQKKFPENLVRFYAAEMALGIGYLHSQNIIYRDLKPENILLDQDGHLKLADFGLSKVVYSNQDRVYTMCGTPEYIAPEVLIAQQGYDKVCDWWSYGCLLYEMFTGYPPFYSKDKKQMLKNRMQKPIPYPDTIPDIAKGFLQGLLQTDPTKRVGFNGLAEVQSQLFFASLDWKQVEKREVLPPYHFEHNGFTYFDRNVIQMNPASEGSESMGSNLTTRDKNHFQNFTYEQEIQNKSQICSRLANG